MSHNAKKTTSAAHQNAGSELNLTRREFTATAVAASMASVAYAKSTAAELKPKYILASSMYGYMKLADIMPEVKKIGATAIDIWPKVHGNQREQLQEMGEGKFAQMLKQHSVGLGCITQYKLGPFGIQKEMQLAKRLGCKTMVAGARGPKGLKGSELKSAVKKFIEQMKPHVAVAEETGVTIAIENHGGSLISSPDSMKWFVDLKGTDNLAIAFAPYHLPQDEAILVDLIKHHGNRIAMFYAWQHGMGCHKKLPKEQELLQMPGRGKLDFEPIVEALAKVKYHGWTEIFMHPVPRGIPILEKVEQVTDEINRSRSYLAKLGLR